MQSQHTAAADLAALIDTYVSPDSVVVFYQNERGAQICEYLRLDAKGKIRQGSANHLAH